MIYWVNREGSLCLAIGAVCGFAGAGLGALVGQHIGMGEVGYVLGVAIGGLMIIVADVGFRLRAYVNDECGLFGAFFWPSNGGTVNWFHASFDGLLFIGFGVLLIYISFQIEGKKTHQEASKKEAQRIESITKNLPRDLFTVDVGGKKGDWTISLTNKQGKDFAKVAIRAEFHWVFTGGGGPSETKKLDWATWKDGETKSFQFKNHRDVLESMHFNIEAYPVGAESPRYYLWMPGRVKDNKWTPIDPPK